MDDLVTPTGPEALDGPSTLAAQNASRDEARSRIDDLTAEVAQLREAMARSRMLGNAVGIVMSRLACDADRAWGVLVTVSQSANVKVREVAECVVEAVSAGGVVDARSARQLEQALREHVVARRQEER